MVGLTDTLKLNTKQDFLNNMNARIANGESDPLVDYRFLWENRLNWANELDENDDPIVVASQDAGVTDGSHRVVNMNTEEEPVWIQQLLQVDNVGSLFALKGFTVPELETILGL
jgi:hypothetical protein